MEEVIEQKRDFVMDKKKKCYHEETASAEDEGQEKMLRNKVQE